MTTKLTPPIRSSRSSIDDESPVKRAPAAEPLTCETADRPPHSRPHLPDIEDNTPPWHGPAGADAAALRRKLRVLEVAQERLRRWLALNADDATREAVDTLQQLAAIAGVRR